MIRMKFQKHAVRRSRAMNGLLVPVIRPGAVNDIIATGGYPNSLIQNVFMLFLSEEIDLD